MPRVEVPGDSQIGVLLRLQDRTLARLDAFPDALHVLVTLPDGTQQTLLRAECDIEPIPPRSQERRDALEAFRPGYHRHCVQHFDGARVVTLRSEGCRTRTSGLTMREILL